MAKAKTAKKDLSKDLVELPSKKIAIKIPSNKNIIIVLLILLVAVLIYRFKGVFVAATVNGQPITRLEVIKQLEKEGGKSVLDTIVTNDLIMQEAAKEKVTASSQEVTDQINQISNNLKQEGQDLNTALAAQGMTQSDLNYQVKLQILVQKMAGKGITVTDKEAQDYYNQNKSLYPKTSKYADVAAQIKSQLQQQKSTEAIQTWITNLKSKAKINYFVGY